LIHDAAQRLPQAQAKNHFLTPRGRWIQESSSGARTFQSAATRGNSGGALNTPLQKNARQIFIATGAILGFLLFNVWGSRLGWDP